MIKVIVVDDEKVIRDGIGRFIRETEGFALLSSCADGLEAFGKISDKRPDLVICDIIMPECDGIELIRKCREEGIKSEFILLSGYSEFEYAKAGIKYGVLDYVNKPINRQEFMALLQEAKHVIESKKKVNKQLKSNVYEKMLDVTDLGDSEPEAGIKELAHRVLAVNTDDGETGERRNNNLNDTVKYCEAWLRENAYEEYIVYKKNGMAILVLMGMDTKTHNIERISREVTINAQGRGFSAAIGAGNIVYRMQDIPSSYKEARAALYEAGCAEKGLCYFERLPYPYKSPSGTYIPEVTEAVNAIHMYDKGTLLQTAGDAIEHYRKSLPPYFIYAFIQKCAQELLECMAEYLDERTLTERRQQQAELATAPDMDRLCRRFIDFTESLFSETEEKRGAANHDGSIDEVLKYIQLHYTQDISIEKICSVFFFNQSYFSVLFKTKTGENYNDYVMELRIKKAKELLRTGRYKVNEIAGMVGYNSSRYFSRVFKMKTGELPQEYKNRKQNTP